jgi:group I intron endonuclease
MLKKDTMKISGIYKIINKINGKYYIGSTCRSFSERFYSHKNQLNNNLHPNSHLQRSWNKYGENNFEFQIVEECIKDKIHVLNREQFYIDTLKPQYNECPMARSVLGRKMKNKTKKLLSKLHIGSQNYNFDNTIYTFFHPKIGIEYSTQYDFYKKYDYYQSSVNHLCLNKRYMYKGWICILDKKNKIPIKKLKEIYKLRKEKSNGGQPKSSIIYIFNHINGSEFKGNIHQFSDKYNFKLKSVRKICYKDRKNDHRNSLFGWKCINPI